MSARYELEALIARRGGHVKATASDILAAGYRKPRTITERADLDALPDKAVVLDANKDVWRQDIHSVHWWDKLDDDAPYVGISGSIALPATVLHEPEAS